ncbi:MAG: response regulator [Prolixibacteraceae bacterium]
MLNFNNLNIRVKLRILSSISIVSLIFLGFISNYFFNTSKVLAIIINAERVHNNTFQEGTEYYFKYQISGNEQWLDSAIIDIESANQMAYDFAIIHRLLQLPEEEYIERFYQRYEEAYNYDRSNAYLMASRVKLFVWLQPKDFLDAQQAALNGYLLGAMIKEEIKAHKNDSVVVNDLSQNDELHHIRKFYKEFAVAISSLNVYANKLLFAGISLMVVFLVLVIVLVSMLISRSITIPVLEMVQKFGIIAKGNLNTNISINTTNEIGTLASSFRDIQNGLREVIDYTKKVATGDYSTPITPRSNEDEMSVALNVMVAKLKESYDKSELDSWFKSGINLLNEKLRGDLELADISTHALSFLMEFLHSQLGSIHLYNPDYNFLKLVGSSGFDPEKLKGRIKLNEGIIGQAASGKRMIILNDIPDKSYTTFSSSGEYKPDHILVMPLLFNELLVGVLELSSVQSFTDIELQFIKQASEIIAINLNSAESVHKTKELLQKTQDQASELQVQQEELRVANEELVEHTKVLTESEKRLQVQQEELRVANEELEERTRQLEIQKDNIIRTNQELTVVQDQMEIKAKELQQASQYKSEFLANMSHELRTPLNSLLILSNLLANNKKGNLTTDQVQSAQIIHKSGTDLLVLINEVLDLSKIEAGKMTIEIEEVKTFDIQDEIQLNFKATAEDKNLALNLHVDKNFPSKLKTDRYRLMQIIRNLLSNAFKFTSQGSISVDFMPTPEKMVFAKSDLNPTNTCCIRVTDSGVGIPEEKLEAIFEAFQQADGSISRKYGGTGLGLSISKELIRMLGGEMKLESQVNKGSSFYIFLPVRNGSELMVSEKKSEPGINNIQLFEPDTAKVEPVSESTFELFIPDDREHATNESTVLIIHPSKIQAEKYLQQARAKNYRVIVASGIRDGILLAEKYNPKAILLAVECANPNDENYLKLKSIPKLSKLPVHLISPVEFDELVVHGELKTLETIEFEDALNSIEGQYVTRSKRILIVEDDRATRRLVTELLSELDVEIAEAAFAEEAFRMLSGEKFDCVILDLGLPDYTGKELLEKLKLNNISLPEVIVYTGKDMSKDDVKTLNNYTKTIIMKGLKSDERLMDEVTLFLHQVSKSFPETKVKSPVEDREDLFKGKKILIVDDEIRNVFALGKMLEERDIEVFEAENGQVAIDILQENKEIDLVLMDVMMPVMDGYEAMRIIRKTNEIGHVPIICLTAKAMKEDHENALKNGANDYLSKPLNEEKLFAMLKIWLYKK